MKDFKGKTAVITGAASGIGYALAEKFANEGMNIVLADIEQDALDIAVKKVSNIGVESFGINIDVMHKDSVDYLFNESVKAFSKVHILCNNAGVASTVVLMEYGNWMKKTGIGFWELIFMGLSMVFNLLFLT